MKKFSFLFLTVILVLSACMKEPKKIDDPNNKDSNKDNITVTQKQETFVLLATATWCGYCGEWGIPAFDAAISGKDGINKDLVNGIALHYSSSDPMFLEMSKTIKSKYGIEGPPNLWYQFSNQYKLQPSGWKNAIKTHQGNTSVSCGVNMNVKNEDGKFIVTAKVKFFSSLSGTYNLAIYAVENNIVASQQDNGTGNFGGKHHRVLRGEITANNYMGKQMFNGSSPKEFIKKYTYNPASGINTKNVQFVAVIYKIENGVPTTAINSNTK